MTRPSPSVLALRIVVVLSGWIALFGAVPSGGRGIATGLVALVFAIVPAALPEAWTTAALEVLAVLVWFLATTTFGDSVSAGRLALVAGALYLHHVSCAWAARIPLDTVISGLAFASGAWRLAVVVAITAVLAVLAVVVPGSWHGVGTIVVPIAGILLALGIAALPLVALSGRGRGRTREGTTAPPRPE